MNNIPIVSSWLVGVMNGVKVGENSGLSNNVKYGTMGLTTTIMWLKFVFESSAIQSSATQNSEIQKSMYSKRYPILTASISAPLVIGTTFCLGTYIGRAYKEINTEANNEQMK